MKKYIYILLLTLLFTVNSKAQSFFQPCSNSCITCDIGLYCVNIPFLGCRCLISLPVELVEFKAVYNRDYKNVYITWITATETNNNYFTIERSYDATNWEVVRYINGHGTSSTPIQYETYDYTIKDGVVYYRLIQTDFDGKFTISGVIYVNIETVKQKQVVKIVNILGQEVNIDYKGIKYIFYNDNTINIIY